MISFGKFLSLIIGLFSIFPLIWADKRSSCQSLCGEFMTDSHPRPLTFRIGHSSQSPAAFTAIKKIPNPRPFTSRLAHGSKSPAAFTAIKKIPGYTGKAPYGYRDIGRATERCYPYCWEFQCMRLYGGVSCNDNWRGCYCAWFIPLPKYDGTPKFRCVRPGCEGGPKTDICKVTSCDGLLGGTEGSRDSGVGPCQQFFTHC